MATLQLIDHLLFHFINHNLSNPLLDRLMPFVTNNVPLLFVPVLLFLLIKDRRLFVITLLVATVSLSLTDSLSNILKHLFQRPRPFVDLKDAIVLVGKGRSYSMPSSHASNSFSVALVLCYFISKLRDSKLKGLFSIYALTVALVVALSRVYVGVHYPSDVIAGALLGLVTGGFVLYGYSLFSGLFREKKSYALTLIFLFALSLLRILYIQYGPLDLSPDEAHYWDWSRNPALSYYSKGPGIAYIIRASTGVFGNTVSGVRLPAVMFMFLSSLIIYRLSFLISERFDGFESERSRHAVSFLNVVLFNITPLFATFGVINTIDSPLIFFWTLSLLLFWHLVAEWPLKKRSNWWWILLGLMVGIGILVKYSMVFFTGSALLYLLFNREKRGLLLKPGPWMGFLVSVIATTPILLWNARHNWVTLLHTAGQAHLRDGLTLKPARFFEFLGSQLGVIGPVLFVLMLLALYWSFKQKREEGFLFWFFFPTFLFFLLKSLQGKVQANWALPCYISGTVAAGLYIYSHWKSWKNRGRLTIISGIAISLFITLVAHYPALIGLPPKMDPSARLRGWKPLGREVSSIVREFKRPYFIFSDRYQITAELAFYVNGKPRTYCVNLGRRMNQYDLWPGFYDLKGYDAVFVQWGKSPLPPLIARSFDECKRRLLTVKEGRYVLRDYSIFICKDFHGMKRELPDRF